MAIDTENKRASAFAVDTMILILPAPDGSIGDADRAHVGGLYSGIATTEPEVEVFDYDGQLTHLTVVDGEVTGASNRPYAEVMEWSGVSSQRGET